MRLDSPFAFGDRVILDGDASLVASVTAIIFRSEFCQIEISWVHCGDSKSAYVDNWRLTPAPEHRNPPPPADHGAIVRKNL